MRDDEARALDERARRLDVNPLPAYVVVREARQVRDFGREGAARIVAVRLRLVVQDLDDGSSEGVRERRHRELDDRIVLRTEPRRLAVDVEPPTELRGPRIREADGKRQRMQGAGFARGAWVSHGDSPRGAASWPDRNAGKAKHGPRERPPGSAHHGGAAHSPPLPAPARPRTSRRSSPTSGPGLRAPAPLPRSTPRSGSET